MKLFDTYAKRIGEELVELLISRHKKYGAGNIQRHGLKGILVRLDDKLARLEHGVENHEDESVEDTLKDIAGYAIVGLMWERGQWPGSPQQKASPLGAGGLEDPNLPGWNMCPSHSHVLKAHCALNAGHEGPHRHKGLSWYDREGE